MQQLHISTIVESIKFCVNALMCACCCCMCVSVRASLCVCVSVCACCLFVRVSESVCACCHIVRVVPRGHLFKTTNIAAFMTNYHV